MQLPVDFLFYLFLVIAGTGSFIFGKRTLKKYGSLAGAFLTFLATDIVLVIVIFIWFQSAAAEVFMGTIPWVFNMGLALILSLLFFIIVWFWMRWMRKRMVVR
ncbi:hypothetical protein [Jeotgalibacillus sp. R-1-5s-1]|uniref:hypothetical protein n=1 Tax=Jeotgalibacillus sp. R-1-5s-1 TaxID=2555897 RepID=UPI00106B0E0C|nr:hypothetical protein [Jeotgalibacillus sp. R-1-5s-1]TFD94418.1 hypothetical protein E2491_13350 [Jeotgalibacillus sp. R-1-5s-1]